MASAHGNVIAAIEDRCCTSLRRTTEPPRSAVIRKSSSVNPVRGVDSRHPAAVVIAEMVADEVAVSVEVSIAVHINVEV